MAMTIFILLNGMGMAFLVYVLVNFWNEGHRTKSAARPLETYLMRSDYPVVHIVNHLISNSAEDGLSVMPLRIHEDESRGRQDSRLSAGATVEIPRKRVSAR